jgi:hypothetical protein
LNFVGADTAGTNPNGLVGSVVENHFTRLQIGLLKMSVMLVGKTNFVGFITSFVANFAHTGHEHESLWVENQ